MKLKRQFTVKGNTFYFSPGNFDEPFLRELWKFRATHMGLKPGVDPEEDFTAFAYIIRRGSLSLVRRDRSGTVRGMVHFREKAYMHESRRFVLIQPEYVFFDKGFHKELGAPAATIWALIRARIRYPFHRLYMGGATYLGGFLTVCQLAKPVWLWKDPDMPQWIRGAFSRVVSGVKGWDPAAGIVNINTFLLHPRTAPPRIARLRKDADRYTSISPQWYNGYIPFCFARFDWLSIGMIAKSFWMRMKS